MKIVIGYDGSACADVAIADLQRAGLPDNTEALVLSSADLLVAVPYAGCEDPASPYHNVPAEIVRHAREMCAEAMSEAMKTADRGAERVKALFPSWRVSSQPVADSAYWSLIDKADHWKADLVVVGSHGRSLVGRLVLGSVSQNVLQHARCSVRIGRCDVQGPQRDADEAVRLVLALDGSPDAALAVEAVRSRTWPAGTEVHVVTAVDLTLVATDFVGWSDPDCGEFPMTHVARRRADRVARELREVGLAAEPFVFEGDPKRVLVHQAQEWGADCIFLGAKGHSRRERFLLGSVSSAVAARAHCSVEVVRQR
jgi:nucleotide-binding universal stress UspA family protein